MKQALQHQQEHPCRIILKTKTWSRDSHGLFDYEASNTKQATLIIKDNTFILRKKNEVIQSLSDKTTLDSNLLARINYDKSKQI
jgi:hypothetical protein